MRGEHSTGVCAVDRRGVVEVYKKALTAADFIQLKSYNKTLTHSDWLLMGHNRYATVGAKDDDNAHPFTHGNITLAHNGTLKSKHTITPDAVSFPTDSETVAYALSCDDYLQVLERLEGAFALTWYDNGDNTINFARNEERELYLGWVGNDLVWASEEAMLTLVAGHMKKELKDVELLPVGQHRMYELGNMKEGYLGSKFVPKKPQRTITTTATGQGAKHMADNSMVGTTIHAIISEVRPSGFLEAMTLTGDMVVCQVPKQDVQKWKDASLLRAEVVGKVSNVTSRWHMKKGYINCLALSSKNLTLVENVHPPKEKEGEEETEDEKKCQICYLSILEDEDGEEHHGKFYHPGCLDFIQDYNYSHTGDAL